MGPQQIGTYENLGKWNEISAGTKGIQTAKGIIQCEQTAQTLRKFTLNFHGQMIIVH